MSSILEALRKSDDKRKQSQDGGVDKIQFSESQQPKQSRKGFYLLVLFLLLIAAGVWAYQAGYLSSLKSLLTAEESVTPPPLPQPSKAVTKPENQITPDLKKDNSNTEKSLQPPKPKNIKKQIAAVKNQSTEPTQIDLKKESKTVKELTKKIQDNKKKGRLIVDGTKASKVNSDKSNQTDKKSAEVKADSKQQYLLMHQLPFAIRQQMPSIKINVHVFDPNPDNRLVIINGIGFNIGDSIEEVATIKDITSEGVVIDLSGTVFLIPK
ncbi:general secretion pathway protein GspB [Marinicella rhabdoformis]|uniref:general secretion pathway protein GspB n=1 Tax=Marinicella rhabdoformis TaxID=2580566 RepID=UPI0012AEE026|nr:general secretion pathway protein GspB [Marinicella rhabdoformis]